MKVSILGTGQVARFIGGSLAAAGHDVVFGSRSGDATDLPGRVMTAADAAAVGEVVINATPGATTLETLTAIGAAALNGKVLVDIANAILADPNSGLRLAYPNTSLAQLLQDAFPEVEVVKTLNTVHAQVMAAPGSLPAPTLVFLSGNSAAAKATVSELLADLGWSPDDQIDLGDISTARATEHYIFLSMALAGALHSTAWNLSVAQQSEA